MTDGYALGEAMCLGFGMDCDTSRFYEKRTMAAVAVIESHGLRVSDEVLKRALCSPISPEAAFLAREARTLSRGRENL